MAFDEGATNRTIVFKLSDKEKADYDFRWITASTPESVTMEKFKDHKVTVTLNDGEDTDDMYFEVWVEHKNGDHFLCDPDVIIRR